MSSLKSRVLASILVLGQLALPGVVVSAPLVSGPVALDDQPINTTSTVKPNIVFTLDNSGSMDAYYAPEDSKSNLTKFCYLSHYYNALYYNPNFNYLPPVLGNGTRLPNSSYIDAFKDGFHPADGKINLQTKSAQLGTYGDNLGDYGTQNRGGHYAKYNDATTPVTKGNCYADAKYVIVDMNAATAQEKQNYANWYSYYRTRLFAVKSSAGEAFRAIGDDFRVGFHTIDGVSNGNQNGGFLKVDTFTLGHRDAWYNLFYSQYANYATPLRAAMTRIGEYYRTGAKPSGGIEDPIQYSCQPNYHILSTDGYWNGAGGSGAAVGAAWNDVLPNNPDLLSALTNEFGTTFSASSPWPKIYRRNIGASSNDTLANIAAYYWQTDLRPGPTMPNNVPTSSKDSASWQHVTQFTIAFSAVGNVAYPSGAAPIRAPGPAVWPAPVANSPASVDDLWSSAVVGHGQYFNVSSPEELLNKLGAALQDIAGRQASGTPSAATANDYENANLPYIFRASYKPGEWTGKLEVREVNAITGGGQGVPLWDAKTKLDDQVVGSGWDNRRFIATMNTSTNTGVPFRWSSLSAAQKTSLDADSVMSQKILDYLRGNRALEDDAPATSIPAPTSTVGLFRNRASVLGAIINSKPHYEAAPSGPLLELYNPGYTAFKLAKQNRTPTMYVGASDGMLHAFKATVGDTDSGEEKWAYVPGMLYKNGVDGLASWAWKYADPLPKKFSHRYRVDQSPIVTDVDFGRAGVPIGTPDWRTILVAGLNKGGKGFYALDVTNPDAASEADVAAKVLWEFTGDSLGDPKMGYSFGEPQIVKTRRFGWVIAVTSGYNNAAGTGHLWLINPKTGAVLHRFDTGVGSASVPSGLGQVNGFRLSDKDNTVEQLYSADLMGNVWRFDVASPASTDWVTTGTKIAAVGEPITTRPVISMDPYNTKNRWVVFGSGKLLGQSDVASSTTNSTFFAIKDGSKNSPLIPSAPIVKADLMAVTPSTAALQGDTVKGWYMTMAGYGQIDLNPEIRRGRVFWAANNPATVSVCSKGFDGTIFARNLGSGGNVVGGATSIAVPGGVAGINLVKVKRNGATVASSQAAMTLRLDKRDGDTDMNSSASFRTQLYGGRSNFRYVYLQ
jgi:type IV pilus assembly protein PilY1